MSDNAYNEGDVERARRYGFLALGTAIGAIIISVTAIVLFVAFGLP